MEKSLQTFSTSLKENETICQISAHLVAPRPTLWGKMVVPYTLLFPWTASVPYMMGIPRRVSSAPSWRPSIISAQSAEFALSNGLLPPPLSTLPTYQIKSGCFSMSQIWFAHIHLYVWISSIRPSIKSWTKININLLLLNSYIPYKIVFPNFCRNINIGWKCYLYNPKIQNRTRLIKYDSE